MHSQEDIRRTYIVQLVVNDMCTGRRTPSTSYHAHALKIEGIWGLVTLVPGVLSLGYMP